MDSDIKKNEESFLKINELYNEATKNLNETFGQTELNAEKEALRLKLDELMAEIRA